MWLYHVYSRYSNKISITNHLCLFSQLVCCHCKNYIWKCHMSIRSHNKSFKKLKNKNKKDNVLHNWEIYRRSRLLENIMFFLLYTKITNMPYLLSAVDPRLERHDFCDVKMSSPLNHHTRSKGRCASPRLAKWRSQPNLPP